MFPEAVPIIDQGIKRIPNLVFTNKLAVELKGEVSSGTIKRLGSLGKEVIGIVRINDNLNVKLPSSLSKFDKAIIIFGPGVGESWLRYVVGLTNTVVGFTLDSLMKFIGLRPHLLNIPSELFIDPLINDKVAVLPKVLPKAVIGWLMDYIDSGGDLYVLVRGDSINSTDLLIHSRLVFTYDIRLAELYNNIIKSNSTSNVRITTKAECDFCGDPPSPICILLCPNIDLTREVRVE